MGAPILHPDQLEAPAAGSMSVVHPKPDPKPDPEPDPEPKTIEQLRLEDENLNAKCEGVGECPVIKDMRRGI